jgi:hypothetical protein
VAGNATDAFAATATNSEKNVGRTGSTTTTMQVQLYVYDLSRGMASTLSQQLTGRQIDGIWYLFLLCSFALLL